MCGMALTWAVYIPVGQLEERMVGAHRGEKGGNNHFILASDHKTKQNQCSVF